MVQVLEKAEQVILLDLSDLKEALKKEEKLEEIIRTYKKEGEKETIIRISKIVYDLTTKHNETVADLVIDTTLVKFWKINKEMKKLQKGYSQINSFHKWILNNFRERKIRSLSEDVVELLNFLEPIIIRKKERITAILEVFASWGSILIAVIAIIISIISINLR